MEVQGAMDEYRRSPEPDARAKALGVVQIKMDTATEALAALRRRTAPVATGKRFG